MSHEQSPLNPIVVGRGVLRKDPLVDDHLVLHVLLELHLHEVIKKTNMRYSGDYQLNLYLTLALYKL